MFFIKKKLSDSAQTLYTTRINIYLHFVDIYNKFVDYPIGHCLSHFNVSPFTYKYNNLWYRTTMNGRYWKDYMRRSQIVYFKYCLIIIIRVNSSFLDSKWTWMDSNHVRESKAAFYFWSKITNRSSIPHHLPNFNR